MKITDRTQCTLPKEHSLYLVKGTYGRDFNAYVSAQSEKEAKQIFKSTYDYLSPKILEVTFISDDQEKHFDRSKMLILGKLNIITTVKGENDMRVEVTIPAKIKEDVDNGKTIELLKDDKSRQAILAGIKHGIVLSDKGFVDLNSEQNKQLVKIVFDTLLHSKTAEQLGSITLQDAADLYAHLQHEDYCVEHNIDLSEMTEDDFENEAYEKIAEHEKELDDYEI